MGKVLSSRFNLVGFALVDIVWVKFCYEVKLPTLFL